MSSRGYDTRNDDLLLSSSRSTTNSDKPFDLIAERRRIHEMYAAQYRQDAENGSLQLGYLPLAVGSQQNPPMTAASKFWGHQAEGPESNIVTDTAAIAPSQRNGPLAFTSRPQSALCTAVSPDTNSETQGVPHLASPQLGADTQPSGSAMRGSILASSGFQPQNSRDEQEQARFTSLESPWATRQPGIAAAGTSASGNVPTRLVSTRANGNQQMASGTPAKIVSTGNNGLMGPTVESFFTHVPPISLSRNTSTSVSSPQVPLQSIMLNPSFNDYYQLSSNKIVQPSSNSSPTGVFPADTDVGRLSLRFAQFTPAPTPIIRTTVGDSIFSGPNSQLTKDASQISTTNNRNFAETPGNFIPSIGYEATATTVQAEGALGRGPGGKSTSKIDSGGPLRPYKLSDKSTFINPGEGLHSTTTQYLTSTSSKLHNDHSMLNLNNSFSPTSNLEDPFLDRYFDPRRNVRDVPMNSDMIEDSWPSFRPTEHRRENNPKLSTKPTLVDRIERNERWNDLIETSTNHTQNRRTVSPCLPALNGIDHYQGSPQQPSRSRNLVSGRSQTFYGSSSSHPSAAHNYNQQPQRSHYPPANQRCGSCYIVKLELDQTKQHLFECMKERDQYHKLFFQSQRRLQESELQIQRLNERLHYQSSPPTSKRSTDSPGIVDTATRLQQFHQRHLQYIDSQYQLTPPDTSASKDDQYFQSEFAMLFTSSVKSWADRYFKFPHQEPIPRDLEEALDRVFERDDYVESLIGSEKTKSFVVQGLVSRFIVWDILNPEFRRGFQSIDDKAAVEEEVGKRCNKICKAVHELIRTLISRLHDPSVVEASERSLQNIFEHAGRLSLAMARGGGDNTWFIDFPRTHEQFKAELMHDAEQYHKNIDAQSLERERAVIKMVAMPLVVRIHQSKQPSVIFRAQVLLRPFPY